MKQLPCWILIFLFAHLAQAHSPDEHRMLADSVFAKLQRECRCSPFGSNSVLWGDLTFSDITARGTDFDIVAARFHDRGKTILEQLQGLPSDKVLKLVTTFTSSDSLRELYPQELMRPNVIQNYLLHHLIALTFAEHGDLRKALIYEAMAQSFLVDAFSSGHMLVQVGDLFYGLHPTNTQDAHDHFSLQGTFVINSRGEAWRAFGDGVLEWYNRSFDHVFEASLTSLREVFLMYYSTTNNIPDALVAWSKGLVEPDSMRRWTIPHDAAYYYDMFKMPTLLLIPMPVTAAWSVSQKETDVHNSHLKKYFPQVRECRDLRFRRDNIDDDFLHDGSAYPAWMMPEFYGQSQHKLDSLIKNDPGIASVKYVQERCLPPSNHGMLLHASWSLASTEQNFAFGGGYDFGIDIMLLDKISIECSFMNSRGTVSRKLISPEAGFSMHPGLLFQNEDIPAIHLASGYAWGWDPEYTAHGGRLEVGLEPGKHYSWLNIPGTYAGILPRLTYQVLYLEKNVHSLTLSLIVH